jgi:hypothetical protein
MYPKRAEQATKMNKRRSLLLFSEPPCIPSASSQSDWFRTFLGCEPRSLKRVYLG